ncbi:hypothetical protein G4G28_04345 [Massilia sp. Dwa41.01b]|uniref:hypothetical protein n=1 Tax=unclassified Massilia TaxID=2609279 RepID=UPI0015FF7948|nr:MULTISPECIES: hypothetical protein [unclassified Massilia]QNA87887.1 hypothetical protein G4G28_04345 [Massilia sp. Dwa41.01b]QNA98792.1 hypothetical protein G4G31_08070 [Massilia sp. Se16.2.3]
MSGNQADPRTDSYTAARVNDALNILRKDGMNPALEFMQLVGVPRRVAMRVLSLPEQQRCADRRRAAR